MPRAKSPDITPAELHEWLVYYPLTGEVRWRRSPSRTVKPGAIAGGPSGKGTSPRVHHWQIHIRGRHYMRSRIIWAMQTGEWPPDDIEVDHRNCLGGDDRWENLRLATRPQNCANRRYSKKSASGIRGVHWIKQWGHWRAAIYYDGGKYKYLGSYKTKEAAAAAYAAAAAELHGEFARLDW